MKGGAAAAAARRRRREAKAAAKAAPSYARSSPAMTGSSHAMRRTPRSYGTIDTEPRYCSLRVDSQSLLPIFDEFYSDTIHGEAPKKRARTEVRKKVESGVIEYINSEFGKRKEWTQIQRRGQAEWDSCCRKMVAYLQAPIRPRYGNELDFEKEKLEVEIRRQCRIHDALEAVHKWLEGGEEGDAPICAIAFLRQATQWNSSLYIGFAGTSYSRGLNFYLPKSDEWKPVYIPGATDDGKYQSKRVNFLLYGMNKSGQTLNEYLDEKQGETGAETWDREMYNELTKPFSDDAGMEGFQTNLWQLQPPQEMSGFPAATPAPPWDPRPDAPKVTLRDWIAQTSTITHKDREVVLPNMTGDFLELLSGAVGKAGADLDIKTLKDVLPPDKLESVLNASGKKGPIRKNLLKRLYYELDYPLNDVQMALINLPSRSAGAGE